MITKINDLRLKAGKRPVGSVNPVLYKYRDQITKDVTEVFNSGCGISEAFPAAEELGWSHGVGTRDFDKLAALYLSLP